MQIQWFVEDIGIRNEADLIAIKHMLSRCCRIAHTLNVQNRSTAWSNVVFGGSTSISFVYRRNFIIRVDNEEPIRLLIHKHHVVFVS